MFQGRDFLRTRFFIVQVFQGPVPWYEPQVLFKRSLKGALLKLQVNFTVSMYAGIYFIVNKDTLK